jgi:hypothetical protein
MPPLSSTTYETPDTTAYKIPEWVVSALAEGKDPADAGASSLQKRAIAWIVSMATAFALLGTPTSAAAQNTISAEAFKKCEAELITDYAAKIAKATADGKPHLVPVYEKRRGEAITNLCTLVADNASGKAEIAANRSEIASGKAEIAAADQKIAANRSEIAASEELKMLFDEAKRIADKITAWSTNPVDFRDLNTVYAKLQKRQTAPGVSEVLPLIATLIAKWEGLKGV